jgi:preprotein translocase subunit SecF
VFFGAGMMIYFSSQGAQRVLLPVIGGTARLVLAGLVGWYAAARFGLDLPALFAIVALAHVIFCAVGALSLRHWEEKGE